VWKHRHEGVLTSTQDYAFPTPLDSTTLALVTCDEQSQGRGRADRKWVSRAGNFYGTFAWQRVGREKQALSTLGLAAAAALLEGIKLIVLPQTQLELKWPNDVLMDGKKVGGILASANSRDIRLGVGVNIHHAPTLDGTALREATAIASHTLLRDDALTEAFAMSFCPRLFRHLSLWFEGEDWAWRQTWKTYGLIGCEVELRGGRRVFAESIGEAGELWVNDSGTRRACFVEEVC
jgi:BirA family biotin operon repressor/biotin-[acetyl-CoA-carboxylase] ligase